MRIFLLGDDVVTRQQQAKLLCQMYAIPEISDQALISEAISSQSPYSEELQTALDENCTPREETMMALVKERLHQGDCYNGFLFNSFPQTLQQAQTLVDEGVSIDFVIELLDKDQDLSAIEASDSTEVLINDAPNAVSYILHKLPQKNHH